LPEISPASTILMNISLKIFGKVFKLSVKLVPFSTLAAILFKTKAKYLCSVWAAKV